MKRKLVKQGAATMMISLPSKWIKEHKLEKGDEIDLEETGKELLISTKFVKTEKNKAIIDISGYSPLVNRILMSYYIKGIDEIEVKFSNKEEINDFQKRVINELLGFEIIKQSQNTITVKDITGIENQNTKELIERIFFILDSMAEEFIQALEKKQKLDTIIEIDTSVNRFCNFCLRVLNKKGYVEFEKTEEIYGIVSMLEEIGDLYKKLAKIGKLSKEQIETLNEIKSQLKLFKELLFKFEKEKIINFAKRYERIKNRIKNKDSIDFNLYSLNETLIKMNNYLLVISI